MENYNYNQGVSKEIYCFGDSLTAGTGGTPYPTQLGWNLAPRLIFNEAIGGQTAEQIMCRQGSKPTFITISGNAFAGAGAVSVTSISTQLLSTAADTTTRYSTGMVNGVPCFLTRTVVATVETYTITPAYSSTASVSANSVFIPDTAYNAKDCIQVIWAGRNNVPSLTNVPTQIDSAVDFINKPKRVIIIGVLNALNEIIGGSNYNAIVACNLILATNYPDNFIPSTPPTTDEMTAINYSPTAQDLIDIANGTFPSGMHADNVHLTTAGYAIFANRVKAKLNEFSWD